MGLAAGFRQSSALFLTPLLLLSVYRFGWRALARVLLCVGAAVSAWLVPMLREAGGLAKYAGSLWDLWTIVPATASLASGGVLLAAARLVTVLFLLFLCFGPPAIMFWRGAAGPLTARHKWFIVFWVAPAILFFTLVFLKFVNGD